MHLDLHLHSTCSDGAVAPAAVVAAARKAGLGLIALADHDTTAGVAPARAAADAAGGGPGVVAAVELTCRLDGAEIHLLGYGFRTGDPGLAALTGAAGQGRRERMAEMVERLRGLGVAIAVGDVTGEAECVSIGRLHLARALVRLGRVGSITEAFGRYIADGGPAHVPGRGPPVAEAIAVVNAAGGLSVWAHPSLDDARHFPALAERGLGGIEALRPSLDPYASVELEQAARASDLVVTGGSDWHGAPRPALGSWFVTEHHVGAFLERLGVAVP
jgi:3',5'-nucleoside bisphosphate phosphatase